MKKLSRLLELRALSNEEFEKELDSVEFQRQLAFKYSVSPSSISREIQIRKNSLVLLGFEIKKEDDLPSKGGWKNSKERHSYIEAGLMSNKSIKYK
jgi:hypothetical protein